MAVSGGFEDDERDDDDTADTDDGAATAPFGGREEETPIAERVFARCLPCLGQGQIRVVDALREQIRPCPLCRGAGMRIILFRGNREVFVSDEMKVEDMGRCKGAFRAGRRAAFGRVACLECGGRFRPLPGLRVLEQTKDRLTLEFTGELPELLSWLARQPLVELRVEPLGLTPVYYRYHGGEGADLPAGAADRWGEGQPTTAITEPNHDVRPGA